MSQAFVPVFHSARSGDCEERAFVLTAVGIDSAVGFDGTQFVLHVDAENVPQAIAHLRQYDAERNRPAPAPPPPPRTHPHAWLGCAIYILVLVGVAVAISRGLWRLDAFDTGALDGARVQAGEWWRAFTALTLHVDAAHLALNLGAGTWFGWLAGRQLGVGTAWLLVVAAAACTNLLEGWLGSAAHRAVGASTAVFAALGLIAAHSWRERFALPQRWARRWGPLVAGVILLGWMGSSGENTDLVGHAGGFVLGTLLGAVAALPAARQLLERVPQWLAGAIAAGAIGVSWALALAS
jgi:membrane associated rhomboid family serine protease